MKREFRWLPYEGRRHAVRAVLVAHEVGETLCGVPLVVPATSPYERWCWPTCPGCDSAWRSHEGIPAFPRDGRAPGRYTPRRRQARDQRT
ncbi:zinc finger protein [Saccharothrix violaceirubra]|uniref:Zinc finger protein n=1 Tax=Saccharothrix violaceirubra TaxID=413306 RepID=A0A7W7WX63_9PSEU|nr:zinc finger protein [Saccharothrix violaceirubra]MBB4967070.1 hypothetical protein [Saccharothrix violaceirubra]